MFSGVDGARQFPYYIVRFKPAQKIGKKIGETGFHTTQYDLNIQKPISTQEERDEFPYYIVRFKRSTKNRKKNRENGFPYYIVRFKLFSLSYIYFIIIKFPYYIVRFKQDTEKWETLCDRSFHTTQYDLNKNQKRYVYFREVVSILHSTI